MRSTHFLLLLVFLSFSKAHAQSENFADYRIDTLLFDGKNAMIVVPNTVSEAGEWVWRARFWGHQAQTDVALLEKGYHLVYVDVASLFGNKTAVKRWNKFYRFVRSQYKLNPKVALEGMSRGGLIIYNWASENTEKVACIYADAPVCDLRSWPGGKYKGKGSPRDWKKALKAHDQTEKTIDKYEFVPIYTAVKVAEAKIPALHICGAADQVVPYEENTAILAERYKAAGGEIEIILKEGVGHHPHSLKDPEVIVNFIESSYRLVNK
jgi:pimeloyl-ACP methyl ester carboxylesterase